MRRELPLPKRPTSVQCFDTPTTPRRPLSSSFFASIDPLTLARHSSLHFYPQHIFPSKFNELESSLEVPYAFSHQAAAFYWTRDDALVNHKLNIWARPPCLNCELAGEDYARKCDRVQRQEHTLGRVRCCIRCNRTGQSLSCIEQIEIRADGRYGLIDEDNMIDLGQWCEDEKNLRTIDLVWWMPINLEDGDMNQKRVVVEQWRQRGSPQPALPIPETKSGVANWKKEQAREREAAEKAFICRQMNQGLVAEWDEEDLDLVPRTLAQQAEEDEATALHRQDHDDFELAIELEHVTKPASDQVY